MARMKSSRIRRWALASATTGDVPAAAALGHRRELFFHSGSQVNANQPVMLEDQRPFSSRDLQSAGIARKNRGRGLDGADRAAGEFHDRGGGILDFDVWARVATLP